VNLLEQARREAVAQLCRAQVDGSIPVGVFEDRYEMLRQAETVATIRAIVADIRGDELNPPSSSVGLTTADFDSFPVDESYDAPAPVPVDSSMRIPAILGSTTRSGPWTVPEHLELLVILGDIHLDFRDAIFSSETTVIDLTVTLGTLKVTVPPGTEIANEVGEFIASSKLPKSGRSGPPNGYLVVLRGNLVLAELVVKEAPPKGTKKSIRERLGLAPP
jgi:hypothetical protein